MTPPNGLVGRIKFNCADVKKDPDAPKVPKQPLPAVITASWSRLPTTSSPGRVMLRQRDAQQQAVEFGELLDVVGHRRERQIAEHRTVGPGEVGAVGAGYRPVPGGVPTQLLGDGVEFVDASRP